MSTSDVLNQLVNTPTNGLFGIDIGQKQLNEGRPSPVVQGEDGQMYLANEYLDDNGTWQINPDFSTPVYYFHQPLEAGDARGNYAEYSDDLQSANQQGYWRTEEEIKAYWDGEGATNMNVFREQNPDMDFNTYMSFIGDNSALYAQGLTPESDPDSFSGITDKYGINTSFQGDTGHVYGWNGSNYTKTYHADKSTEVGRMLWGAGLGALTAGALGPALGGGAIGKGAAAGIGNAAAQGALTGSIDPRSVLASAVVGGLNPGGMLGDKLGLVPDNVTAGFVQGATNSAVGDLISTGDLDLKDALIAGGIGAGTNAVKDLFSDTGQFSVESEMRRIELEREMQGLPPLSTQDLYAEAMLGNMTGKSDLGGLIGDDGLLPFIPAVSTGGLNNLLGGGYFDPNAVFTGPDGKEYTDLEVIAQGQNPSDIFTGGVDGWSYSASSGYWSPVKGDGGFDNGFLDALGEQEFKNQYGMTPTDFLAGGGTVDQLKQMIVYGPLDETYNWSDNPRGNSQYVGLLTGLVDGYSTGSLNDQREYQAGDGGIQDALNISNYQDVAANAPDPNGGSVAIINLGGGETVVDPNATLPGSNITVIDAITQGIIDGILVDNSGSATGGNTAGNTADVIGNENAVSTDDVLAGADTNTNTNANINTNENAVSTDDTLAGADTSTNNNEDAISTDDNLADNENAVSTDDVLPSGGNDGGGADDGLFNPPSGDGLPPLWSELYGYSKISSYKGARLKILNDIVAGLNGQGMMTPKIVNEPYMKLNRDLLDAGILS